MRHSPRFLSTFEAERADFGESGRQKSDIHPGFCLLSRLGGPISESQVDKNQAFPPVFVYFRGWAADFGDPGRQKSGISTGFCLLSKPRGPILESPVDKNEAFILVFVYFLGCADRTWRQRFCFQGRTRHD